MQFLPIKTRAFKPPKDDIFDLLRSIKKLKEGDIVVITSKVLAIHQGRCIKVDRVADKDRLAKSEAERYLPRAKIPKQRILLTLKKNTLIATAGIDESNGNGYYVLWPRKINQLCKEICEYLKKKHKVKKLAVITTDSHLNPTRKGVIGISIGFFGLEPLKDYRGTKDIFGKFIRMTRSNIVDSLAAIAVLLMGEGDERKPIVVIRGMPAKFTNKPTYNQLIVPFEADIYYPLLRVLKRI